VGQKPVWALLNKTAGSKNRPETLKTSPTLEELGAWLIHNHLYDSHTMLHLLPNPTMITIDDIQNLFNTMNRFFKPVLSTPVPFNQLLVKAGLAHLFVSVNTHAPKQQQHISDYTAIYMNTWGELFHKTSDLENEVTTLSEFKQELLQQINIKNFPDKTLFHAYGSVKQLF
jgi:adenylate cyclase, class 1